MLGLLNLSVKHGNLCDFGAASRTENRLAKVPVECVARPETAIMAQPK